jgi:pimeloyl-ACP methyl ester carboxylesterase
MKRFSRLPVLLAVLAVLAGGQVPAAGHPNAGANSVSCITSQLQSAEPLVSDTGRDGAPVKTTTLPDGTSIPVVVVHGWTGRSVHDNARKGAFSRYIDLTANKAGSASVGRSLIGQLQDVGGTQVYTFDYHDASARWVTDGAIAPQLAQALTCLSQAHQHPAVVVAHSMGGLATRQALKFVPNADKAAVVSDVITFGTPNTGSWVASVVAGAGIVTDVGQYLPGATGRAIAAVRSMLVLCGTATTSSLDHPGICSILGEQLASSRSDAGRALRVGSPELGVLPAWPDGVQVHALGGSIGLELTRTTWFGLSTGAGDVNVGDFVVDVNSATRGTVARTVECSYTMDMGAATSDNFAEMLRLRAANETRDWVFVAAQDSACAHGNLTRSIELTNEALAVTAGLVDGAGTVSALPAELRGEWCTRSGNDPLLGGGGEPCFSFAELMASFPDAVVEVADEQAPDLPDVWQIYVCLEPDLDDGMCSTAVSMFLKYFPAGVQWSCQDYASSQGWATCDPDFTSAHEPSSARLVIEPNHQQGEGYRDTEPMYRRG